MVAHVARLSLVAVAVALHISSSPATASDGRALRGEQDASVSQNTSSVGGAFGTGSGSLLDQALSGILGLLGQGQSFPLLTSAAISLSLPREERGCRVEIVAGREVTKDSLHLILNAREGRVTARFQKQAAEQHDQNRGGSFSSRTIQSSSTLSLPKHCIVTTAALLSHLGGCILDFGDDEGGEEHRGKIIFPSSLLLREYIEQGLLPTNIIDAVTEGEKEHLEELTPQQLCLVAGFTPEECEKIGNRKPEASDVAAFETPEAIPIPLYGISLRSLE